MERIQLSHGSGGKEMHELIRKFIQPTFEIEELADSAIIPIQKLLSNSSKDRLAFTTDSYVVSPIFFPGGNIGDLAINGTINDLAMVGADPLYISLGIILEEGFLLEDLEKIVLTIANASKKAEVKVVTGDIKVVEKGKGDGIYINTSGIGIIHRDIQLGPSLIKPKDKIIVSGLIGNHGIAVLSKRYGLSFEPEILSDSAPLHRLVQKMLEYKAFIKMMRDPTRGGLAAALNEIALQSGYPMLIYEELIPCLDSVKGACELLGINFLHVANEGVLIAIVSPEIAEELVDTMKGCNEGINAAIIGEVQKRDYKFLGSVLLKTSIGGMTIVDMPLGEQLPRIC